MTDEIVRCDVHLYAVVRVKVCNVPGNDDQERIDNAMKKADLHARFLSREMSDERERSSPHFGVAHAEFTEGFDGFLVDHVLKEPNRNGEALIESWYEGNGDPLQSGHDTRAERALRILGELVNQRRACVAAIPEEVDRLIREAEDLFPAEDDRHAANIRPRG